MRLFKSGQADAYTAGYSSSMSIVRDDCDEPRMVDGDCRCATSLLSMDRSRGNRSTQPRRRDHYVRAAGVTSVVPLVGDGEASSRRSASTALCVHSHVATRAEMSTVTAR